MSDIATGLRRQTARHLSTAVHRNGLLSREGLRERMFTFAFRHLVYPQIWEDPVVDMDALAIRKGDHVVTIASGGCNALSYLVADPAKVTALDLNDAHVALNRLKIAAAQHLPQYGDFRRFFADADVRSNVAAYDRFVAPHLDAETRRYWEGRTTSGRRRIGMFARGFHRFGLLGRFIGAAHVVARLNGCDPRLLLKARNRDEQRAIFDDKFAPVFDRPFVRRLVNNPASLYGLGIPPAQYRALAGDSPDGIAGVLRARLERLACGFDLKDNYFAWQAFARGYEKGEDVSLPPYLEARHFDRVRERAGRVDARHQSMTEFLRESPAQSVDCVVLLDAQDWMNDADLTELWQAITRAAKPGARVIFRTAADERLLPGRIPDAVLSRWNYDEARCRLLSARDRSSIYGAFHLYTLRPEA